MMVDVGVPCTGFMMISYSVSEIEAGRDSLRTKMIIDIDLMMSYIISEIEIGRNFLGLWPNERRRGVPTGHG